MCFLCTITIILFYFYNESSSRKSFFFYYYEAQEGPQRLTTANKGQRRPTKTKKGPNDDRYVFFMYNHFIFTTSRHPVIITAKPRTAHSSQRRRMQAHEDEKRPKRRVGSRLGPR